MSLRRSPKLTPAALAARRANSLKSTGPRTERGKAWSSLNGLRHGWDARDLRGKIERTGDKEAAVLFDWIFTRFFELCDMQSKRSWNYHLRLAARVWCHVNGRILLPRVRKSERKGWSVLYGVYRYGGNVVCPRRFELLNYRDVGIRFINPYPCRRKHVRFAWIPKVEFVDPPPRLPRAKRVRERKRYPGEAPNVVVRGPVGSGGTLDRPREGSKDVVGPKLECALDSTKSSANSRTGDRAAGPWAELAELAAFVPAFAGLTDWEKGLGSETADEEDPPDRESQDERLDSGTAGWDGGVSCDACPVWFECPAWPESLQGPEFMACRPGFDYNAGIPAVTKPGPVSGEISSWGFKCQRTPVR